MRENGVDPLILDAGDLFFSTKEINDSNRNSEAYRAEAILEGYQKIGCDAINIGQYEILNGLSFLKNITQKTGLPFISTNLKNSSTDELLFDPYRILYRGELKIGVVGSTNLLPDTCKSISSDDFIESCNKYANQIADEVDVIVALVNASRSDQNGLADQMPNVDFIITSGSTNMSRSNSPQKKDGPYIYSCGKQGKYLLSLSVDIKDNSAPFVDVSAAEKKINSANKRFERLQKKDPEKSLEEIYKDQENVLKLIKKYREDIVASETLIASAVNTIEFEPIPLNKKVEDDKELLAFVTKSVKQCDALGPKKPPKPDNSKKSLHKGHNH